MRSHLGARLLTGPAGVLAAVIADWLVLLVRYLRARATGRDPWA